MLLRFLKALRAARSGNVTMITAGAIPAIVMFALVGVDLSTIDRKQLSLQAAADAAAIAAALAMEHEDAVSNPAKRLSLARAGATASLASNGLRERSLNSFELVETKDGAAGVRVKLVDRPKLMMKEVLGRRARVEAEAAAVLRATAPICVMAVATSGHDGVLFNGPSDVEMGRCAVQSNSPSATSLIVKSSRVSAASVCAAGEIEVGMGGDLDAVSQRANCAPVDDPLAQFRPSLPSGGCDHTGFARDLRRSETLRLEPGVYCGGVTITGAGRVNFASGVYQVRDAALSIATSGRVRGRDVTFALSHGASLDIRRSRSFLLSAPERGRFAGLIVYDPEPRVSTLVSKVAGAASEGLEGAVYLPGHRLFMYGPDGLNVEPAEYTLIIASRVGFLGPRPLRIRYELNGRRIPWASQAYFSGGVRLVSTSELAG